MKSLFVTLLFLPVFITAQVHKSALFLGNSYTYANDLPKMIGDIAASKRYNAPTMALVDSGQYDYLILQEQSIKMALNEYGYAKHRHLSFSNAHIIHHQSQLSDSCRKTLLYLTWGRKNGHPIYEPGGNFGLTFNDMQDYLTQNYLQLAQLLGAELSPVGEAWRKVLKDHPNIELYTNDGSHPSVAGTYLAACVFYQAIFQESAHTNWHPSSLSNAVAEQLQTVADWVMNKPYTNRSGQPNNASCFSAGIPNNFDDWTSSKLENHSFNEFQFIDNHHGLAKASGPSVWQTEDAGQNWNLLTLPAESDVDPETEGAFDITFVNPDTLWYVVNGDEIDSSTLVTQAFEGSMGDYASFIRLFRSTDGGVSWEERSPVRNDHEIFGSGYLSGRPRFWNFSMRFDKSGQNGTVLCNYRYASVSRVIYSFTTHDGGLTWQNHHDSILDGTFGRIQLQSSSEAYVSGYKFGSQPSVPQKIFKTHDAGISWNEDAALPNSCCPLPTGSIAHHFSALRKVNADTLLAVNSLSNPTFYRSINGGFTWDSISSIPTIGRASDILQLPGGVYYLLFNNDPVNRVLASYDYGITWQAEAFFPDVVQQIEATEDFVYILGKGGNIYRKSLALIGTGTPKANPDDMSIFPNPSHGIVNVQGVPLNTDLVLYNSNGAVVAKQSTITNGHARFETQNLASGLYVIQASHPGGVIRKKLILGN
jgi:hypothetical protein